MIRSFRELDVYQRAFDLAMDVFEESKRFPREEKYALTDQSRRAARSVAANIAEAWHKRRYKAAFVAKLSDAETEAAEAQVWIQFAVRCGYLERDTAKRLHLEYKAIISMLIQMIRQADEWTIKPR